jgi:hypothetical protein
MAFEPKAGENRSGINQQPKSPLPAQGRPAGEQNVASTTLSSLPIIAKTPKRNALKQYQRLEEKGSENISEAHRIVLERRKKCPGQLIQSKTRGTCPVCLKSCMEYCVLCHHHCHGNNVYLGAEEETFEMNVPHSSCGGAGLSFRVKNSCFWYYLHKDRSKEFYEKEFMGEDNQ